MAQENNHTEDLDATRCTRDHSVRRELETEIENVIEVKA